MNRRSFLKSLAGGAVLLAANGTDLIVEPKRRYWLLDKTLINDHTRFLQMHIDRGLLIPPSQYQISGTLVLSDKSKGLFLRESIIESTSGKTMLRMEREMGTHEFVLHNMFKDVTSAQWWEKKPCIVMPSVAHAYQGNVVLNHNHDWNPRAYMLDSWGAN